MLTSPTTRQFYGSLELLPTPDLEGPLSRGGSHTHVAARPAAKDEPRTVVPRPCAAPGDCGHCSLSGDLTDAALPKWREGSLCAPWTPSPAEAGRQSVGGEGCRVRSGGGSSWMPACFCSSSPLPHASSLLTSREGPGGSLGWRLPAWAALRVKAEARSHPTPSGLQDCEGPDVRCWQGQALELELTVSRAEAQAPNAAA